jgi:hypothetical protein
MELERTIRYFQPKQALYDEYDTLNNITIPKAYSMADTSNKIMITYIIVVFLTVLLGGFCWLGVYLLSGPSFLGVLVSIVAVLGIFLVLTIPGVAICAPITAMEKDKGKAAILRSNELANELEQYFEEFGYCVVGMEYTNPAILHSIYDMVRLGRADTPKEALNALIQDRHQRIMEMRAQQIAFATRATAANTGITAVNTGITAWFCAAAYLLG